VVSWAEVLRVLVLTPDFPPARGGIQVLVHRLVAHAGGLDSRVIAAHCAGAEQFDEAGGLEVQRVGRRLPARKLQLAALNAVVVRAAVAFRPQVVLSMHIVTSPGAWLSRLAIKVPVVQYLYADEAPASPWLTRFAMRRAQAVVAISAHTRTLALRAGAHPDRVHLIPPGTDLPERQAPPASGPPTVLSVARLDDRYKGHDVLIEAMRRVKERVPDARCVVVGEGSLRGELEAKAERDGVDVRFVGAVSDPDRDAWFARAHVFAMPSRLPVGGGGEGFGIVFMEAAAHGLPVVAGGVGGALDAVVDGETGLLVDPTDPAAVARAIGDLLLDPDRAEALGRAAAERARGFAWPRIAARVEDLLEEVAAAAR
jgi:phosphatidylinositol alpha-1,6-mannosyltransferase